EQIRVAVLAQRPRERRDQIRGRLAGRPEQLGDDVDLLLVVQRCERRQSRQRALDRAHDRGRLADQTLEDGREPTRDCEAVVARPRPELVFDLFASVAHDDDRGWAYAGDVLRHGGCSGWGWN